MRRTLLYLLLLLTGITSYAKDYTVVIDAGHGGKDPGAVSANKKVREKDINLNVALMVGDYIKAKYPEVKVLYTRSTDKFVELNERARIANRAKADLFISIHVNAATNTSAKGAETYTLGIENDRTARNLDIAKRENSVILLEDNHEKAYNFNPNSAESYIIFEFMQSEFVKESIHIAQYVQENFASDANRHDRGVRQAGFWVLHATSMPSILVELGYISNTEESKYLASSSGQKRLSTCIGKAFDKYYTDILKQTNETLAAAYTSQEEAIPSSPTLIPDEKETEEQQIPVQESVQEPVQEPTKKATKQSFDSGKPVFKIQFLSASAPIKGNQAFKGLSPVSYYYEKGLYKYTYGATTDYNEILRLKKKVNEKFKDAFIVAFINDNRIDTKQAIAMVNSQQ